MNNVLIYMCEFSSALYVVMYVTSNSYITMLVSILGFGAVFLWAVLSSLCLHIFSLWGTCVYLAP